uniref:Uncharacterized protein n=2 Tax=Cacopsylla melanoneura TaxID=428564 RepID=A0A8D9EAV6_9HEMI
MLSTSRDSAHGNLSTSVASSCLLSHQNSYLSLSQVDMKPNLGYSYPMDISKFSPDSTSTVSSTTSSNYPNSSAANNCFMTSQNSSYCENAYYMASSPPESFKRNTPTTYYDGVNMDNSFLFNNPSPPCIRYDAGYSQTPCISAPPNS